MRDPFEIDEDSEVSWREYLTDFETEVWPIFQAKGYTKDTALLVWTLNKTYNVIQDLEQTLESRE